jgi:hypothetical protein
MASETQIPLSRNQGQPNDEIELGEFENSAFDDPHNNPEFSLPPTDMGKDAWLFLLTCFVVETLVWGMFFSSS